MRVSRRLQRKRLERARDNVFLCLAFEAAAISRSLHGNTASREQLLSYAEKLRKIMEEADEPRALLPFARWWEAFADRLGHALASEDEQDEKGKAYLEREGLVRVRDWDGTNKGMPRWVPRFGEDHVSSALTEAQLIEKCIPRLGMDGVQE